MGISIIVPIYNEGECIIDCLNQINNVFLNTTHEIIIVNDGSTDNSHQIILQFLKNNPSIKYIFYPQNKGYSYAIRKGFERATKNYVSFIDADLQYHPRELLNMYNYALKNNFQFVMGIPKTRTKYYNPIRKMLSFFYNTYISLLFNFKLNDANSLKLMSRKYLESINFRFDYGMIEIETLLGFKMQGVTMQKYPINVRQRIAGKSKCSAKIIYHTIIDCAKLRFSKNTLIKNEQSTQKK